MTDKKFTDEEIIETLECCAYSDGCERCQCSKQCDGAEHLINALDLINRQKAEIERLKECPKCVYEYDGEITEYCVQGPCQNFKTVEQIKAEAYKEFAEKIKKSIKENVDEAWHRDDGNGIYDAEYVLDDIDTLLKEMVGEEE